MSADIASAIDRLQSQLPLQGRQQALPPALAEVHRAMLHSLAERGRPLTRDEIAPMLEDHDVEGALARLSRDDLVVLGLSETQAVGAYPMTVEDTPHHLKVNGRSVNAMCALDGLSVGPMFDAEVDIESRCRVTGESIRIHQHGSQIDAAEPSPDIRVGVRWQDPTACAAHSMCLEMVFLKDGPTALAWQEGDTKNVTIFTLPEAVQFGAGFFNPLVRNAADH